MSTDFAIRSDVFNGELIDSTAVGSPSRSDSSRFEANNVTFAFASDFSRDLTVYLRSISYDTLGSSPLLSDSIPVFVNSLVTHMGLPREVCEQFEAAFKLTWNETVQLYVLDDEKYAQLLRLNPSLTLTLGHAGVDGDTVDITLPYGAFDLQGSPPFLDPPARYFPLKRAQRAEQYTSAVYSSRELM